MHAAGNKSCSIKVSYGTWDHRHRLKLERRVARQWALCANGVTCLRNSVTPFSSSQITLLNDLSLSSHEYGKDNFL
jgi:hypothetical protein